MAGPQRAGLRGRSNRVFGSVTPAILNVLVMSYQWLQMRIAEEQDRRHREAEIRKRLPLALEELSGTLRGCIETYNAAFGSEAAELTHHGSGLRIVVREERNGRWGEAAAVELTTVLDLPGFRIECGSDSFMIEVGVLPNDKVFYRDREQDQYLTMDGLTRRILDRALFPKLGV